MDIGKVSIETILCLMISGALSVLVPIGAAVYLGVKKRLNWKAMLFGALLFVGFALILEGILHRIVLGANPTQSGIFKTSPYLFALYGGLAAGVFEETARLTGFKFILKVRKDASINTGISYGIGHGGIEAILLAGLAAISNIVIAFMINTNAIGKLLQSMPAAQADTMRQSLTSLVTTPSYLFLISGFERLVAMVIQVSLSIIVFRAVVSGKWILFAAAILLHAVVDFPAALYQAGIIKSVYIVEGWALLLAVLLAAFAYTLHRRSKESKLPEQIEETNI